MIWSQQYLAQLALDAEQDINKRLPVMFHKFYLTPINAGTSVYTMPSFLRSVLWVTWRGKRLDALNWEEATYVTPATVVLGPGNPENVEPSPGRPLYYWIHPTNPYDLRFYPTPGESFDLSGTNDNPYAQLVNEPHCCIACFRNIDSTYSDPTALLPQYVDRRMRKAFVLWKAFEAEGQGQVAAAAAYYKQKYEYLIELFKEINNGTFISKKYSIEDGLLTIDGFRYPRPMLPSNFERVIY